jgi:hypothetical protein
MNFDIEIGHQNERIDTQEYKLNLNRERFFLPLSELNDMETIKRNEMFCVTHIHMHTTQANVRSALERTKYAVNGKALVN